MTDDSHMNQYDWRVLNMWLAADLKSTDLENANDW